jgi:hypothetical protein
MNTKEIDNVVVSNEQKKLSNGKEIKINQKKTHNIKISIQVIIFLQRIFLQRLHQLIQGISPWSYRFQFNPQ